MTTSTSTTYLSPAALAQRWGVTVAHLANLRSQGREPSYLKPAGRVRYALAEIERIEAESTVQAVGA